jgi:hypothetical protein
MMPAAAVRPAIFGACAVVVVAATLAVPTFAQRGGGRGGGGTVTFQLTRLEILASGFDLNKDQKRAVKTILDDAHKSAAPVRERLTSTRAAIAAAIQAGKEQTEIDRAIGDYAEQAAAMTALEMTTLAHVIETLDRAQRGNSAGIRTAFFLMRGIFLDKKRWDDVPDSRGY